jgi:cobalamin biosynthesis Mg chelatase CobN
MTEVSTVEAAIERAREEMFGASAEEKRRILRELVSEVQQAEREECAKVCDRRAKAQKRMAQAYDEEYGDDGGCDADMYDADSIGAEALASAIRSRGSASASEGNKKGEGE